jgi:hypothetical protein
VDAFDAAGNRSASSSPLAATTMSSGGWQSSNGLPVQSTTAAKSSHNDQGPRRIARIGDVTIALADGANNSSSRDGIYRSADNGRTWNLIGVKLNANRGTIITSPGNTFMAFWVDTVNGGIYMTSWQVGNVSPPVPYRIYAGYVTSVGSSGGYQQISATVNSFGHIFVAWHSAPSSGQVDKIYFIRSVDNGVSWTSPSVVYEQAGRSYIMPHIIADHGDTIHLIFADGLTVYTGGQPDAARRVYHLRSVDSGTTWSTPVYVDGSSTTGASVSNISIIESRNNNLFVFGQRNSTPQIGLVCSKSTDSGATWSAFALIDRPNALGYADPSVAIGSDGAIFATFRQDRDESGVTYSCPTGTTPCWTNVVVRSLDEGTTWTRVDSNRIEDRTGPANSMRYQTWWNYGGPLEWTWELYLASNSALRPVYYDINTDIRIFDIQHP